MEALYVPKASGLTCLRIKEEQDMRYGWRDVCELWLALSLGNLMCHWLYGVSFQTVAERNFFEAVAMGVLYSNIKSRLRIGA